MHGCAEERGRARAGRKALACGSGAQTMYTRSPSRANERSLREEMEKAAPCQRFVRRAWAQGRRRVRGGAGRRTAVDRAGGDGADETDGAAGTGAGVCGRGGRGMYRHPSVWVDGADALRLLRVEPELLNHVLDEEASELRGARCGTVGRAVSVSPAGRHVKRQGRHTLEGAVARARASHTRCWSPSSRMMFPEV